MSKKSGYLVYKLASIQIFILILSIFSFAFIIEEISLVKAQSSTPIPYIATQQKWIDHTLSKTWTIDTPHGPFSFDTVRQEGNFYYARGSAGTVRPLTSEQLKALPAGELGITVPEQFSYKVPIVGAEITNFLAAHLVQGLFWSIAVVGAIQLIGGLFGADRSLTNALSKS